MRVALATVSSRSRATPLMLAVLLLSTNPASGWGQSNGQPCIGIYPCPAPATPSQSPRWQGHALALGINAALGGLSAGIVRAARGESFRDAFFLGAAGGGITYFGKYVAAQQSPGAGLIGRQAAGLGASLTRNAITGSGSFERLSLPLGPILIHYSAAGTRLTLDLPTVAGTIYGLSRPGSRFDLKKSLATGAVVFEVESIRRQRDGEFILGMAIGGVILYRTDPHFYYSQDEIIAHEVVHVVQHDFAEISFSSPFEEWLATKLPGPLARPLRYLDLGSHMMLRVLPEVLGVDSRDAPWEREAYFLVPGTGERDQGGAHILDLSAWP